MPSPDVGAARTEAERGWAEPAPLTHATFDKIRQQDPTGGPVRH
ncbi:hypothetical protein [Streptomyces sp. NPDC059009]